MPEALEVHSGPGEGSGQVRAEATEPTYPDLRQLKVLP